MFVLGGGLYLLLGLNGARVRSVPPNSSFSLMVLAKLLMSLSRARGLGGGGVGTKLRPSFNTDISCLVSTWEERLTT